MTAPDIPDCGICKKYNVFGLMPVMAVEKFVRKVLTLRAG